MPYPATQATRRELTGSVGGAGIKVNSTSVGVELHTHDSTVNQSQFDELHLWAYNSDTSAVTVTLQWGGTTSPDNLLPISINNGSFLKVVDGLHIGGDLSVNAIAGTANKIILYGYAISHGQREPLSGSEYNAAEVLYYTGYVRHE